MADLKISELPALTGALLQAADPLAVADLSASETKKISALELAAGLGPLFPPGSINASAVTVTVPAGSIGTAELVNGSVTAIKLANDSSATVGATLPAAGVFVGQLAVETTGNTAHVWTGVSWVPFKAGGSVNTIGFDNSVGVVDLSSTVVGDSVTLSARLEDASAAAQFLAGPTGSGGAVGYRGIVGTDLPVAAATTKGAVQVSGGGLRMTGNLIEVDNDIVANAAYGVVSVSAKGLVTGTRAIQSGDLPLATSTTPGIVVPGTDLEVGVTGILSHPTKVPGGGTFTKVSVDTAGHVTAGTALTPADVPNLDASKITTGAFTTDRLADRSVTAIKLADYSTAYIQDVQPANTGNTIGQLWLNPLAQQIRMWDGNVWVPIGVGALSEQNLRFCGLFDATNGQITILTQFGRDAGFKVGDTIPVATDQLTGVYFVCQVPGNAVGQDAGVTYDAGDWIVCLGVAQGWERVDTLNGAGGGGGGGASALDDLVDVSAPSPSAGQFLGFDGAVWKPVAIPNASATAVGLIELATQAEVDAGVDAVRAVTPATLKQYVSTNAPTPPDATTAVKGVVQFADATSIATGDATRGVTADQLKTTNDTLTTATTNITTIQGQITTIQGQVADATTAAKGIVQLADAAAVTAGTAGLVVTADQLKVTNDAVTANTTNITTIQGQITTIQGQVVDASDTAKGIVELATNAEVATGTDTVRAVTSAGVASHYLAKNIALLAALP